jgi:glycosyltransferase involved in cell wall biosynthesis
MKILYHHRVASRDGQAVHIDELIAALRARGHEVIVVAPGGAESQEFGTSQGWVDAIRKRLPRALYELAELGYAVLSYRRLAKRIREHRPDVIYERYNLYLLAGAWARKRFGLPLLLEVNAPIAEERHAYGGLAFPGLARRVQAWTWRGADCVLPVTTVLAGYVERAGVPAERIEVIPNGINPEHFRQAPERAEAKRRLGLDDRLVLGFVGFVREWHGLDRVLEWLATRRGAGEVQFVVVGDGPAREGLEAQAAALGIVDRVRFTGVVPRDEIPGWVAAFDIALQPAVVEYASPLKLFEYLALGCAVVAPGQENLREILVDGVNARLFDPERDGSLCLALDGLVNDVELRERLGDGARRTITERNLTWHANAGRVCARFERLLAQREPAAA